MKYVMNFFITCSLIALSLPCVAEPYAIIICGSGGEEPFIERFPTWGTHLSDVLVTHAHFDKSRIQILTENGIASESGDNQQIANLETIEQTFIHAATILQKDDPLYIFLIGHGSFQRDSAKLNIPGPDLDAEKLSELMDLCSSDVTVIINGASTSAAFINTLSAPGRIITTSTKNTEEHNATEFIEQFILTLADGSADVNRDDRVSILEACRQAAHLTEAWYLSEGYIATEHALIDDNGDGYGTRLILEEDAQAEDKESGELDGKFASKVYLADYRFPPNSDPALRAKYLAYLEEIQVLKTAKANMDIDTYYVELERLLLEAARTNRLLRSTNTDVDHE